MTRQSGRRALGFFGVLLVGLASFAWGCAEGPPEEAQADVSEVAAQSGEMDAMKAMLVDGFTRAKAWDMALAEGMPEDAMEWAPAEGVRNFADQIVHAAGNGFIGSFMFGEDAPAMAVSEGDVPDKATLVSAIEASYDWIITQLNEMPAEDLAVDVTFIGEAEMPRWRVATFALEHAMWTRGQTVPYFHANGAPVPDNVLFGG